MIRQVVPVDASWKRVNAILLAFPCRALGAKGEQLRTSANSVAAWTAIEAQERYNAYHLGGVALWPDSRRVSGVSRALLSGCIIPCGCTFARFVKKKKKKNLAQFMHMHARVLHSPPVHIAIWKNLLRTKFWQRRHSIRNRIQRCKCVLTNTRVHIIILYMNLYFSLRQF